MQKEHLILYPRSNVGDDEKGLFDGGDDNGGRADAKVAADELLGNRPKPGLSREEILKLIKEGRREFEGRGEAKEGSKS